LNARRIIRLVVPGGFGKQEAASAGERDSIKTRFSDEAERQAALTYILGRHSYMARGDIADRESDFILFGEHSNPKSLFFRADTS